MELKPVDALIHQLSSAVQKLVARSGESKKTRRVRAYAEIHANRTDGSAVADSKTEGS